MSCRQVFAGAVLPGLLTLLACSPPPAEESASADADLEWEDRELERFSGECDSEDDPCGRFRAEYPEFIGAPVAGVAEGLNEAVVTLLTDGRPATLAGMANELLAAYRAARQEFPGAASTQRWEEEKVVRVIHHDDRLVSLKLEEYSNTGGAHPNARTVYGSWSLADGRRVRLEDLLAPGFEEALSEVGEARFREVRGIGQGQALEELGFDFPGGEFKLPENFAVTREGLVFCFNSYEVGPYVLGGTEFSIPFEEIGELVKGE